MTYQLCIDTFKVCKDNQLLEACFVPNIPLGIRMCLTPLFRRNTEQGNVQHIRFIGIGETLALRCYVWRDQYIFDCIRVNTVIDFRKCPIQVPSQRKTAIFIILQTLIVLDDI